jgi:hypothetical protein
VLHGADARMGHVDGARTGPVPGSPWWEHGRSPVPAGWPLSATSAVPPSHELGDRVGAAHHEELMLRGRAPVVEPGSGAAGSRTRVPRSRRCGLYVRRCRIISDVVLRRQTAPTSTPPADVPIGPGGPGVRVEPRVVAPAPLRGVRGGTSRRVRPREPSHRWHLWFPARFVEVTRASSARSPGAGLTTVETMSAPGWWRASARCSCQATGAWRWPAYERTASDPIATVPHRVIGDSVSAGGDVEVAGGSRGAADRVTDQRRCLSARSISRWASRLAAV